ncbi:DUF1080 domain-containing protein [Opitutales bacterium]|nr:DUF1080 domain-containing protein [Opitutales bacterium]MDC0646931.1 DUF1080 domain-containing protein [Opitutales bacterium]
MKYILINLSFIWATALFAESGKSTNLLNAKSLQLNKHWEIAEGVLTTSKTPGGILWTKGKFGDFEVTLEYKTSEKANSGLFFRTDPRNPVQGGFEIQIASPGLYSGKHVLGSLYDAKEASVSAGKPDGEWNVMTLTCKGPSIKATVNGQTTVDVNIDQWTERKKNPDGTKNKFKTPLKDMPRVGHLGLQYHGQPVWFRKFEIKPLN